MRYFDLHCDTMTECAGKDAHITKNDLQVDLNRADVLERYVQCYAVWMPDELRGPEAFGRFSRVAERFSMEISHSEGKLSQCRFSGDLDRLPGKHAGILTVENATALGGNIENVAEFARLGVKLCSLTWNGENELGGGVRAPKGTGITPFGKRVVAELERSHIIIDVSHASPELFYDVLSLAKGPIVATHSNAKSVCGHARNLTDEQFRAILDCSGLVGMNFYKGFLHDDPSQANLEDVLRHAEHFLALGGEDILALGADWDGGAPEDFVAAGIEAIPELYEMFLKHNYSESLVDKIFYQNAAGFFIRQDLL